MVRELLKRDDVKANINDCNKYGLTPFASLFWNMDGITSRDMIIEDMIANGADPNVLVKIKPLSYIQCGYTIHTRAIKDFESFSGNDTEITPLIAAVVHRNSILIGCLSKKVNLDLADSNGMTPLMHAAKTNDVKIVKQILFNDGAHPEMIDSEKGDEPSDIDVNAVDKQGYNALFHILEADMDGSEIKGTFDNVQLYNVLTKAGVQTNIRTNRNADGKSYKLEELAEEVGAFGILKKINGRTPSDKTDPNAGFEVSDRINWDQEFNYDIKSDARKMLKKLEEQAAKEAEEKAKKEKNTLDAIMSMDLDTQEDKDDEVEDEPMDVDNDKDSVSDDGSNSDESYESFEDDDNEGDGTSIPKDESLVKPVGCIVKDGQVYDNYTILMTKIDVSFGAWGLYNFYRMQIWKEKHKDLWILYTNWGRIGGYDRGQYQNTPFGSAEQAKEEFEKIFKAKSGNEWADKANFENKPKKYRLVKREHLKHVKKSAIKFDLATEVPSKLTPAVQEMITDIANVNLYMEEYKTLGSDIEAVPFGRIKRSVVEKALEILEELRPLIKDKLSIEKKRASNATDALQERLFDTVEKISKLSSEYYYMMPKSGLEYTKLMPIDNDHVFNQEERRVKHTLDFEVAERLLLGAMYRKKEINPLDYLYRAMDINIDLVKPSDPEANQIMQYVYNSPNASVEKIEGIFRLARKEDHDRFGSSVKSGELNRKLLWHGSKAANLMSIFMGGLMVDAPFAPTTGRSWGDGLYTADQFQKSLAYTFDYRSSQWGGSKYMLLVDVARGRPRRYETYSYTHDQRDLPGKGYHSVEAVGNNVPDPIHDIKLSNGLTVPLGKVISNPKEPPKPKSFGWHGSRFPVDSTEYVTFDASQTALRYVVQVARQDSKRYRKERRARKRAIRDY